MPLARMPLITLPPPASSYAFLPFVVSYILGGECFSPAALVLLVFFFKKYFCNGSSGKNKIDVILSYCRKSCFVLVKVIT